MSAEFEEFTKALEQRAEKDISNPSPAFDQVAILGGGAHGKMLGALCLSQNRHVTLFSAYGSELNALRNAGGITIRGDGPVGTYQVDLDSSPSIQTTAELDFAVKSAQVIFLTGPVHKHRTYAMVLAEHLQDGQTLVVAPGRTFAALEVRTLLKVGGCRCDITVVEVQNLPYWSVTQGNVLNLSESGACTGAAIPGRRTDILTDLENILPNLVPAANMLHSSFADASGIVESVGLMFGESAAVGTGKSLPPGAEPLSEHQNFHSLLASPRSQSLVSAAFAERRQVASRFGVRNLPDDDQWRQMYAGGANKIRFRPHDEQIATVLRNAVTGSLIPLQSAGRLAGVNTPVTDSLITVAGALLGNDVGAAGRRLESWGISANNADDARKTMESLARGEY